MPSVASSARPTLPACPLCGGTHFRAITAVEGHPVVRCRRCELQFTNPQPSDAELTRLGKPHEFHSYDGAGHSFFSVDRPAYRVDAAVDGWRRIDAFFATHLKG